MKHVCRDDNGKSPSSRRAWIEISSVMPLKFSHSVALLAEGVDRNFAMVRVSRMILSSPSSRRAWIEINMSDAAADALTSPSSRRAWIEIVRCLLPAHAAFGSPSSRRAWIEILEKRHDLLNSQVALLAEGVDRNVVRVGQ